MGVVQTDARDLRDALQAISQSSLVQMQIVRRGRDIPHEREVRGQSVGEIGIVPRVIRLKCRQLPVVPSARLLS